MTADVTMYSTRFCPYCMLARQLLEGKGAEYKEIDVDTSPELRQIMMKRSGRRTVPQIWVGDQHVGGFDDLAALDRSGNLDKLLNPA